jgi:hypothetical protein
MALAWFSAVTIMGLPPSVNLSLGLSLRLRGADPDLAEGGQGKEVGGLLTRLVRVHLSWGWETSLWPPDHLAQECGLNITLDVEQIT